MDIPNVPDSITREVYQELIQSLGFCELKNLVSLEFKVDGIYAEMRATDERGRILADGDGEIAMHRVYIPIRG